MSGRTRSIVADALVGLAILIAAVWVLRRVIGMVLWLAGLLAVLAVVLGLLALARWVRRGGT